MRSLQCFFKRGQIRQDEFGGEAEKCGRFEHAMRVNEAAAC
jgi:hypothetical protein